MTGGSRPVDPAPMPIVVKKPQPGPRGVGIEEEPIEKPPAWAGDPRPAPQGKI
jgi:hypothetical protein